MDNSTLEDILASHEADEHMGGLQIPAWFFGENLSENTTTLGSNGTLKLVIDSVWRGKTGYRGGRRGVGREKMIIRPRRVVYFACHRIISGGPRKGEPKIRLNHYKLRDAGVAYARNKIVKDDSFQSQFGPLPREQLKLGYRYCGSYDGPVSPGYFHVVDSHRNVYDTCERNSEQRRMYEATECHGGRRDQAATCQGLLVEMIQSKSELESLGMTEK